MVDRILRGVAAFGIALGVAVTFSAIPVSADGPCEDDPYCHPYMKRPAGGDPCGAWECNSAVEICCIVET